MSDINRHSAMLRECQARLDTARIVMAERKEMIDRRERLLLLALRHIQGSQVVDVDRLVDEIKEVLRP